MSNAFAIAAVTAVLIDLLSQGLKNYDLSELGDVPVDALPPDRIAGTNAEERNKINLFMYHVTPNSGWRNIGLPSRDGNGARLTNPPLALDLHYLVTAYGADKYHAEILLGCVMQILHEQPLLTRKMIAEALNPKPPAEESLDGIGSNHIDTMLQDLFASALADQVELIKITPETLTTEEMSRLWTATQARYRPTAAYQLSVVLIQETKPVRSPLPVLTRGPNDQGPVAQADLIPPFPTLERIDLPNHQISAQMNDRATLSGHHLAGEAGDPAGVSLNVQLTSQRLEAPIQFDVPSAQRTDQSVTFSIPHQTGSYYPAGFYRVSVQVAPDGKPEEMRESNELALSLAPRIMAINGTSLPVPPNPPISIARTNADQELSDVTLQVKCSPEVLVEEIVTGDSSPNQGDSSHNQIELRQFALLLIGDRAVFAEERRESTIEHQERTDTLTFVVTQIAAGTYRLRLRIDGVDSLLVDRSDPSQPKFDESQQVVLT